MASNEVKQLIIAHKRQDEVQFSRVVNAIIANAERSKHTAVAADLRRIMGADIVKPAVALPVDRDSRLPLVVVRTPSRTMDDIIVSAGTRKKLIRVVEEVNHWPALDEALIPRRNRVLLYGPPGCGKTTTAEALATELGRPLIVARIDSLINSHMGNTGSNISALFDYMKTGEYVVLLDEFDGIAKSRSDAQDDVGEMRRVVNTLLQQIDAYQGPSLIIAATNFEGVLDSALWRRFDTVAEMPLPSVEQIEGIIRKHVGDAVDVSAVHEAAAALEGMSHAAAEHLGLGARRNALFAGRTQVTTEDMAEALEETTSRRWA